MKKVRLAELAIFLALCFGLAFLFSCSGSSEGDDDDTTDDDAQDDDIDDDA